MVNFENEEKFDIPLLKRIFDIAFSLVLIIIFLPLFIIIITLIFVENIICGNFFAPFFYVEKRISQGKAFNFLKFAIFKPEIIMKEKQKEKVINTKKIEHEKSSMLLIGSLIQKVYLDELPQLFNILKGDMSFVGPRPVNLQVYKMESARGNNTKGVIKTGLTGIFQSQKGTNGSSQMKLDMKYINFCRNNPTWKIVLLDIVIIIKTIKVIFRAEGI